MEDSDQPAPGRQGQKAPALISLDRLDGDATFQLRPEGDLSNLATDLARLGQLVPVELRHRAPDRFQVVCGFRRVAALRLLQREAVVARLHMDLTDDDALLLALAEGIHRAPLTRYQMLALKARLASEGRLSPIASDMLEKAIAGPEELSPESVESEVDADELADELSQRLGTVNQDLSLLADVFDSLDEPRKTELLRQLRYAADLVAFLEGR